MTKERIARINELARKAKTEALTEEEIREREILRREYIESVKANLTAQLDNTWIVDEHGRKHPLPRKDRRI